MRPEQSLAVSSRAKSGSAEMSMALHSVAGPRRAEPGLAVLRRPYQSIAMLSVAEQC